MQWIDIVLVGFGLAMDAFAVSLSKGLCYKRVFLKLPLVVGFTFSFFQMVMPLVGYLIASNFTTSITFVTHLLAFFILGCIGVNMLLSKEECSSGRLDMQSLLFLGIATSLDALAVGLTFAFLKVSMFFSISVIGIITFCLCFMGVYVGNYFGKHLEGKTQIIGGVILIIIAFKILFIGIF